MPLTPGGEKPHRGRADVRGRRKTTRHSKLATEVVVLILAAGQPDVVGVLVAQGVPAVFDAVAVVALSLDPP